MTAALEGSECSAARPGRTLPRGKTRYPFYRRLGGPQGRSGRAENLVPTGIRSRTVQPIVSHYTDWATRPTHLPNMFRKSLLFLPCRTRVNTPCPCRKGSTLITKMFRKRHIVFHLKGLKFGVVKPILKYEHVLRCFLHICNFVGAMRNWYIYPDMLDKTAAARHVTFLCRGEGTEVMRFVEIALKSVILVHRGNLTGWWKLFSGLCQNVTKLWITVAVHFEILTGS